MFSLFFIKNKSFPKIVVNLLNVTRTFSQKHIVRKSSLLSCALFEKPRIPYIETQLCRPHLIKRYQQTQHSKKITNVANNVILYKLENIRFFKIAQVVGAGSVFFWAFTMWYLYKDKVFSDLFHKSFQQYVEDNLMCISLFFFSTLLGPCFYAFLCLFCARTIKSIILKKGGKHVTFITLHPLQSKRIITAPIQKVHCQQSRSNNRGIYTTVKINPYRLNFLIDNGGTYVNADLFDHTIGWRKYMT